MTPPTKEAVKATLEKFPWIDNHWKTWATKTISLSQTQYDAIRHALEAQLSAPPPEVDLADLTERVTTELSSAYDEDFRDDAEMVIRDTVDYLFARHLLQARGE